MLKEKLYVSAIAIGILCLLIWCPLGAESGESDQLVSAKLDPDKLQPGGQGVLKVTITIPEGIHQTLNEDYLFLDVTSPSGIRFDPTIYPEGEEIDGTINYYDKILLTRNFSISEDVAPGTYELQLTVGYQFCDEVGTCFFPQEISLSLPLVVKGETQINSDAGAYPKRDTMQLSLSYSESETDFANIENLLSEFIVADVAAGYLSSNELIEFLEHSTSTENPGANNFADMNILLVVLLILLGGFALNLTPCVLPMIPVTIAILGAGTQAESKGRGFLIGGTYGLGMMLAYGALGVIVVLTGGQFGAINSSPWFNLIIAAIFVILSLAMFDVIPIDLTRFRTRKMPGNKGGKGKFITVFILGAIAAILAGACVAPVLISVILYATSLYANGNPAGLLLPFLLGAGMALPWPFAGAGLSLLPKPGKWMDWVKRAFGIIILVIALYYGYTGIRLFQNAPPAYEEESITQEAELQWTHSLPQALQRAQKEKKPVFIDFWATWCKNCLAMNATTFKEEEVKKATENFILVKYQAEDLKKSPTKEILDYFGIIGLPSYIVLIPK